MNPSKVSCVSFSESLSEFHSIDSRARDDLKEKFSLFESNFAIFSSLNTIPDWLEESFIKISDAFCHFITYSLSLSLNSTHIVDVFALSRGRVARVCWRRERVRRQQTPHKWGEQLLPYSCGEGCERTRHDGTEQHKNNCCVSHNLFELHPTYSAALTGTRGARWKVFNTRERDNW